MRTRLPVQTNEYYGCIPAHVCMTLTCMNVHVSHVYMSYTHVNQIHNRHVHVRKVERIHVYLHVYLSLTTPEDAL